jgi:hypothetical protein
MSSFSEKYTEFKVCMNLFEVTEKELDSRAIHRCLKTLKKKINEEENRENLNSDELLYIFIIILSCTTDDTIHTGYFEPIFEEAYSSKKLLKILDTVNSSIYPKSKVS